MRNKKKKNLGSREIIKYGDAEIILLEEIIFDEKKQLRFKEREYCEKYKSICVNKLNPILSDEERKTMIRKGQKKYVIENRDSLKEKFHCECGGKYTYSHKQRHMETNKHLNYLLLI